MQNSPANFQTVVFFLGDLKELYVNDKQQINLNHSWRPFFQKDWIHVWKFFDKCTSSLTTAPSKVVIALMRQEKRSKFCRDNAPKPSFVWLWAVSAWEVKFLSNIFTPLIAKSIVEQTILDICHKKRCKNMLKVVERNECILADFCKL